MSATLVAGDLVHIKTKKSSSSSTTTTNKQNKTKQLKHATDFRSPFATRFNALTTKKLNFILPLIDDLHSRKMQHTNSSEIHPVHSASIQHEFNINSTSTGYQCSINSTSFQHPFTHIKPHHHHFHHHQSASIQFTYIIIINKTNVCFGAPQRNG